MRGLALYPRQLPTGNVNEINGKFDEAGLLHDVVNPFKQLLYLA